MSTSDLSADVLNKLEIMQKKLGTADLESTIDKSLNMAYFIAEKINDPSTKVLVEQNGKYQELKGFA